MLLIDDLMFSFVTVEKDNKEIEALVRPYKLMKIYKDRKLFSPGKIMFNNRQCIELYFKEISYLVCLLIWKS